MRVPGATYRLQVNDDFTLDHARVITPYLAHLGITDLYLSPIFEARRGSTHGYDITDPTRVRASIGGIDALRRLAAEVQHNRMGILLDIVPNHMAASAENPWWRDVLVNGAASPSARFFDIDWGTRAAPRRLRLPILADDLDAVIDQGGLRMDRDAGELVHGDTRLPLATATFDDGSTDADLRRILDRQHYELVPWRDASTGMSYRRFFDITDLAAVRVEDDEVFRTTHALVRDLARDGIITGLRIDHIDGLRDPAGYLSRLREHVRGPDGGPVFTLVEKVLARTESLPTDWECEGTTGYEFLRLATGLLIEPDGFNRMDELHREASGDTRPFGDLVREKKLLVMNRLFRGELAALARDLGTLTGLDADHAGRAIAEVTASMLVYRTATHDARVRDEDRHRINASADDAVRHNGNADLRQAIDALRQVALLEPCDATRLAWVMRWQQFTGPVMAKGFEDTALYCHNAMLAANDVGSDPAAPSLTPAELHDAMQQRHAASPLSLNATATHDTKRGEDTRARIAVLTELPEDWDACFRRWMPMADATAASPSADVESLLYQTLLGAWPLDGVDDAFRERIKAYMTKAVREADEQTSWRRPDDDYEQALDVYIERLMAELGLEGRADDVGAFARRIAPHGALNSMAQMLFKVTAPGIPDFYQGVELWSHTLVDPDNRAAIDFDERRRLLDELLHLRDSPDGAAARELLESWRDGRIKLLLTAIALRFRATHRDVFERGEVVPLPAIGTHAEHTFAFARRLDDRVCITVLPRWTATLGNGAAVDGNAWGDTAIPLPRALDCALHDALTGETYAAAGALRVSALFRWLPFALLEVSQPIGA